MGEVLQEAGLSVSSGYLGIPQNHMHTSEGILFSRFSIGIRNLQEDIMLCPEAEPFKCLYSACISDARHSSTEEFYT